MTTTPSSAAGPPGAATAVVIGPDDHFTLEQVSRWVRGLLTSGAHDLVVDVTGAQGHDGRLLTVLIRTHAELAATGATLRVTGAGPPQVLEALQAARVDEMFLVHNALRPGPRGRCVPGRATPGPARRGSRVR